MDTSKKNSVRQNTGTSSAMRPNKPSVNSLAVHTHICERYTSVGMQMVCTSLGVAMFGPWLTSTSLNATSYDACLMRSIPCSGNDARLIKETNLAAQSRCLCATARLATGCTLRGEALSNG
eukprot:3363215-Alexandrium_andersonii.AAC.1